MKNIFDHNQASIVGLKQTKTMKDESDLGQYLEEYWLFHKIDNENCVRTMFVYQLYKEPYLLK